MPRRSATGARPSPSLEESRKLGPFRSTAHARKHSSPVGMVRSQLLYPLSYGRTFPLNVSGSLAREFATAYIAPARERENGSWPCTPLFYEHPRTEWRLAR